MRYKQLLDILKEKKPKTILEIGTWNGVRAREMMQVCPGATYYGFDLFENATSETDLSEFNVKPHYSYLYVTNYLHTYNFPFHLIKGNTRETLLSFNIPIDFAFIDGGHSVETIKQDWKHIKRIMNPGGIVVFDDYYTEVFDGFSTQFGCNRIIEDIPHVVLPDRDIIKGGGYVQLVRIDI